MPVCSVAANRSDSVAAVLNPTHGIRDEMVRKGQKPHDHARDNRLYIKQLQRLNRASREDAEAVAAATPHSSSRKYKEVASRVAAQLERPASAPAVQLPERPPLGPRNFIAGKPGWQANQAIGWKQHAPVSQLTPDQEHQLLKRAKVKPPVPKPDTSPRAAVPTNFVQRNASLASLAPRRRALPNATGDERRGPHHGVVPPYLLDRKLQLAKLANEREEAKTKSSVPPGHRVLLEEVRGIAQ